MTRRRTLLAMACTLAAAAAAAPAIPLPEHPRPDLRREQWLNLNGPWAFDFDPDDAGEKAGWSQPGKAKLAKQIVVPFPWESKLSGIERPDYRGVAWYAREVTVPAAWEGKRAWLVFGAVDWAAKVWVNGKLLGEHVGGYTPFGFDITGVAAPGQKAFIVVRADDPNHPEQPGGKQHHWYTHTGGIWQTVYLEARGEAYLDRMQIVTDLLSDASGRINAKLFLGGDTKGAAAELEVVGAGTSKRAKVADDTCRLELRIPQPHLWSPDDPHLYDAVVRVLRDGKEVDRVHTYLGVRTVWRAGVHEKRYQYITLNHRPIYLRGALHQSFHPDGIYQYPDDKTLRWDYEYAKKIGINFLRIHIKTEIPRALYWADKLGVLIMEDQPNFARYTERSKKWWESVLRETVARDFNHPSVIAWCNFNETWGIGDGGYKDDHQAWVIKMFGLTKKLDPTRLVEDNSPCRHDHVVTDINSWHFYINDYARARDHIAGVVEQTFPGSQFNYAKGYKQGLEPLINSEYGGISAGKGDQDVSWCFKYLTNELRKHDKVCGYVYTEQSDIEWEHNGFLNYDRSEKVYGYDYWFPGFSLADLNAPDFVVLDVEPCPVVKAGETLSVPVLISHWSDRRAKELTLHWQLDTVDRWGDRFERSAQGSRKVSWKRWSVTPAGTIKVKMPDAGPWVCGLRVWLADAEGERVAANYINAHVDAPTARVEVPNRRQVALRFAPNDFAAWQWAAGHAPPTHRRARHKAHAQGTGHVEYELAIPEAVPTQGLQMLTVLAELSAKAGDEKLAWPARKKPVDYPQTDKAVAWPTEVAISINGVALGRQTLEDDPADARGVLSHQYRYHPGSFGWRVRMEAKDARLLAAVAEARRMVVRFEVPDDAEHKGGLAIFGERLGRFPMDPMVVLTYAEGHDLKVGPLSDEPVAVNRLVASRETVVATADDAPTTWRYTTARPAGKWMSPAFDDGGWKTGKAGFGSRGTPNAVVHTNWRTPDIWLRTPFDLSAPDRVLGAMLRFYHDEDVEIFLNARRVAARRGYVAEYIEQALKPDDLKLLRAKGNVLAVHCRQTRGGQNIDVGLSVIRRRK